MHRTSGSKAGSHNILGRIARPKYSGAINLLRRLIHHRSPPKLRSGISSIELTDKLTPRDAGVGRTARMDRLPFTRGIKYKIGLFIHPLPQAFKGYLLSRFLDLLILRHMTIIDGIGHQNL